MGRVAAFRAVQDVPEVVSSAVDAAGGAFGEAAAEAPSHADVCKRSELGRLRPPTPSHHPAFAANRLEEQPGRRRETRRPAAGPGGSNGWPWRGREGLWRPGSWQGVSAALLLLHGPHLHVHRSPLACPPPTAVPHPRPARARAPSPTPSQTVRAKLQPPVVWAGEGRGAAQPRGGPWPPVPIIRPPAGWRWVAMGQCAHPPPAPPPLRRRCCPPHALQPGLPLAMQARPRHHRSPWLPAAACPGLSAWPASRHLRRPTARRQQRRRPPRRPPLKKPRRLTSPPPPPLPQPRAPCPPLAWRE